ncbi:MAG: NF038130 family PEP-CTERM protein [Akkermansiaceae bacterium]
MKSAPLNKIIVSAGLLAFSTSISQADISLAANLTGDSVSGSTIYILDTMSSSNPQEIMFTSDPTELINALGGDINFAGGNVELYAASDGASITNFKTADHVELTLDFGMGNQVTLSSLNGQDWFNSSTTGYDTTWGADNLANQWFNDFVDELDTFPSLAPFTADRGDLFETFRDSGGFQQQSDPNISYVEVSGNEVRVGLGGFIDIKPRVAALVAQASGLNESVVLQAMPDGIQSSEVVLIDGIASYSFEAVNSGVFLDDGVDSYSATYVVTAPVPEPTSSMLLLLGAGSVALRRKR